MINLVLKICIDLIILKLKSGTKQVAVIATQIKLTSRCSASTTKKGVLLLQIF